MAVQNAPNPSSPAPVPVVYPSCLYPSWWGSATTIVIDTHDGSTPEIPVGDVEIFPWGVSFVAPAESGNDNTLYSWAEVQDLHMAS